MLESGFPFRLIVARGIAPMFTFNSASLITKLLVATAEAAWENIITMLLHILTGTGRFDYIFLSKLVKYSKYVCVFKFTISI